MTQPKLTRRTKLAILAVFISAGLIGLFLGSPVQRYREAEENSCREKCAKLQKASRLVSQDPLGMVGPGKYDGPWNGECY